RKLMLEASYMSQEIEIEYKNLLTKQEFDYLLGHFPFPQNSQKQTNFYFETENFSLKENGAALRIREKDGHYRLTLKEPHPDGLLETHDPLTEAEAMNWLQGNNVAKENTKKQLKNMQIETKNLNYYGSLTTERRELEYNQVLLVLDYSRYNGQADYELELEAPSEAIGSEMFNGVLADYHIPKRTTPNKIKRFFSSLSNKHT